jgi:lipoate-protein ligase A
VTQRWTVIDDVGIARPAAGQMAADEAMAATVAAGSPPLLRLYTWSGPALSLGRFQPDSDVERAACAARGVSVVRRPTGGRALLHGADVTYAVALPRPPGREGSVDAVYCFLARGLRAGLAALGVDAEVASGDGAAGAACFASMRGSDLRVGGRKLCGSAQVVRGSVVLQHGSVLVDRLPYDEVDLLRYGDDGDRRYERARLRAATVTLRELGVDATPREVADAIRTGFAAALDLELVQAQAEVELALPVSAARR